MKATFEEAFEPFVKLVNDTGDLAFLIKEFSKVEQFLFKTKSGTILAKVNGTLPKSLALIFGEIENGGLEPFGDQKQLEFLRALLAYLKSLPVVTVTLAYEPGSSFVARLNTQISETLGKKVLLDITVDKDILGGARFEYGGRVGDYTLEERAKEVVGKLISK